MLSPGGVGRARPYRPRRRRGARLLRVLAVLLVFGLIGAGTWYLVLREPPKAKAKTAACDTRPGGTAGPAGAAKPVAGPAALKPAQVTVNVYNATQRKGLAAQTAAALRQRGFVIGKIANDPLNRTIAQSAEVRSGAKGKSQAALVTLLVAGARPVADQRTDASVDLVLGQKFTTLRTPAQVTALQTPQRPTGC